MRIVSLLPAATEWVCTLGGECLLVGRSHACDYPVSVATVPRVTSPTYVEHTDSAAIDAAVSRHVQQGLSLYHVDVERLRALQPDLILTQDQCDVCAVAFDDLKEALSAWLGSQPAILSMHPRSVKQVMDMGLRIGRAIERSREAMDVIGTAERELHQLRSALGLNKKTDTNKLPRVVCIEWLEPLMTAGHWMPDVIELAGGKALLAEAGSVSAYVAWEDIRTADPDVLLITPCGFTLEQTHRDLHYLTKRSGWGNLRAVRNGRVYCFDGNAYFNRPGPRIYRSIALVAQALYGEAAQPWIAPIEAWEMQSLDALMLKTP